MLPEPESAFRVEPRSQPAGPDRDNPPPAEGGKAKGAATTPEDRLADAFAELHKDRLRYIAFWGRWLEWNGMRWAEDATRHAYDLVRACCKARRMKAAAKTINAAHTFAQADRRLAATPDDWDTDPDLFNQGNDE